MGRPPERIRNAILAQEGEWELRIPDSTAKVSVAKTLRRELNLLLSETAEMLRRIPGAVATGTKAEMGWLSRSIRRECGVIATVERLSPKPSYPDTIASKLDCLGLLVRNGTGRGRFYDWLIEQDLADHMSRPTKRAVEQGFAEVWRVIPNVPTFSVGRMKDILPSNPFLSAWADYDGVYLSVGGLRENLADPANLPMVLAAMRNADWSSADGTPTPDALADGRARMGTDEVLGWLDDGLRTLVGEFETGRRKRTNPPG